MRPALHTLIAAGESLTLELKKSTAEKDRACRSLCALANGQGGQVVFGVTPAGNHAIPEFPQFNLRVARFKGTTRDEFLDNRQYAGSAFALMRRAERFLIDWMPVAGKIVPGQMARIDTPALPVEAVREALANAFIHRDYASAAGSVSVALYDDRLEVISPGELHFGLTPEKLYLPHESKPWNPWIAKVFYRRGLIETWGRGTLKIAGLMQEAGLAPPTLKVRDDFVTMTFDLPAPLVRTKNRGIFEKSPEKSSEKSSEKILQFLRKTPAMSAKALAEKLGISSRAVEKQIELLKKAGFVRRVGPAKGGHWEIFE